MLVQWRRVGDFYDYNYITDKTATNRVSFVPESSFNTRVRKIKIYRCVDHTEIHLWASPSFPKQKCRELVPNVIEDHVRMGALRFATRSDFKVILDDVSFLKLNEFFLTLNQQSDHIEFSSDLLKEIDTIWHTCKVGSIPQGKHVLPLQEADCDTGVLDDSLIYTLAFDENRVKPDFFGKVRVLLGNGANPNIRSSLFEAIEIGNLALVKLLLYYKADPFGMCQAYKQTAIEIAEAEKRSDIYDLFMSVITKPQMPVQAQSNIEKINMFCYKNQVITAFHLKDQTVASYFKQTKNLTPNEHKQLYEVYSSFIESDKNNLRAIYNDSFNSRDNNFIELIKASNNNVIGAVLHTLIKTENNELFDVFQYEFIKKEFRNLGISALLTYRLPYALQLLYPQWVIIIGFLGAHKNSVQRIQKDVWGFKYESPLLPRFLDIYQHEFGPLTANLNREEGIFYVEEENPIMVKGPYKSENPDVYEEFYHQFRGSGSELEIKKRSVPVIIPGGDELLERKRDYFTSRGISFLNHVFSFESQLKNCTLLDDAVLSINRKNKEKIVYETRSYFWKNERKKLEFPTDNSSTSIDNQNSNHLRSCL